MLCTVRSAVLVAVTARGKICRAGLVARRCSASLSFTARCGRANCRRCSSSRRRGCRVVALLLHGGPIQSPHPCEPVVDVARVHLQQQLVGTRWFDDGQGACEDDGGPRVGQGEWQAREDVIPLLADKGCLSGEQQGRRQRQHLDPVDVLLLPAKPSGVVHLVLEKDTCGVIPDEVWMVMEIAVLHEEVLPDTDGAEGQHGGTKLLQGLVACLCAPQVEPIKQVQLLRRGLLVLPLCTGHNPAAP
mmetsp:Transcript_96291/g.223269  ORF Transcript_96291/g.223269 Transcript_96291/m.223269 type:complete len:245 (+) Transcript_96291:930-1664(+)